MHERARPGDSRGRFVALGLAALALLAIGTILGRTLRGSASPHAPATTVTVRMSFPTTPASHPRASSWGSTHTSAGAVAAAGAGLVVLGGETVLDPAKLSTTLDQIAARSARADLQAAYTQAESGLRTKFGLSGEPKPVVIVRTVPLGYRVESFTRKRAVVSVWTLAVLGSGATFDPVASWRTQTVTLVWENHGWKVTSFGSANGPTPGLAAGQQPSAPADLFTSIPTMREYADVAP
jgi:hypothetical protein